MVELEEKVENEYLKNSKDMEEDGKTLEETQELYPSKPYLHPSLHHEVSREWTEPHLHQSQLIFPIFVTTAEKDCAIQGFGPNVQWGIGEPNDNQKYYSLITYLQILFNKGLRSVMLFGVVSEQEKDARGSSADDKKNNPVILAIRAIRKAIPKLMILCDVCMCEYTSHGHCGLLRENPSNKEEMLIDNPKTIVRLANIALSYVKAGAHYVCPSDMMDGRVSAIRNILDLNNYQHVGIMSYTSKKASMMYSPFRAAVKSTFKGNRKRYQHPIGSKNHADIALKRDLQEGADVVIVKPALFYGDIISKFSRESNRPIAAYLVSGEYVMLQDYGKRSGDLEGVLKEAHIGLLRAGASIIITYYTPLLLDYLPKW